MFPFKIELSGNNSGIFWPKRLLAVKQSLKNNWDFIMSEFWRSQLDFPEKKPKFTEMRVLLLYFLTLKSILLVSLRNFFPKEFRKFIA